MDKNPRRGRAIAIGIFAVIAIAFYWVAGGVMDWLRVTMHGR